MPKEIFIIEDHPHLVVALTMILNGDSRFHVCGVADDIPDAMAKMPEAHADLVFVDINLPGGSGLGIIPMLKTMNPTARFLVFSAEDPAVFASPARQAGANGFLRKGAYPAGILEAAAHVLAGEEFFPAP